MFLYQLKLDVPENNLDEFIDPLRHLSSEIREEQGCLDFSLYRHHAKKEAYRVLGKWKTRQAMEAHFTGVMSFPTERRSRDGRPRSRGTSAVGSRPRSLLPAPGAGDRQCPGSHRRIDPRLPMSAWLAKVCPLAPAQPAVLSLSHPVPAPGRAPALQ